MKRRLICPTGKGDLAGAGQVADAEWLHQEDELADLAVVTVTSMEILWRCTSMIFARKISQICINSPRVSGRTLTRIRTSSRSTLSSPLNSCNSMTSTSLRSCFVTCSKTVSSPRTTIVIRDVAGSSVGPTLRVSMLKPRPLNIPAMRVSTPNLFSTRTERV